MPYKANEARRHKIPKARFRIENWPAYDAALRDRGDLTIWVAPEALAAMPRFGHTFTMLSGRRSAAAN